MFLERAGALLPCLPILAIPAWSVWRVVKGARVGDWRRPGWFGHAAWASFAIAAMAWIWGAFSAPGLRTYHEVCGLRHRQPFDEGFYQAHRDDYFRLFPLTSKCNAGYDLVPAWVNPTVLVFFLLFLVSTAGLGWTTAHRRRRTSNLKGSTS
ncbi:MAG TPA: hypothetical protein VF755_10330 [Catenuloplanes sp.]|jgi:hypothetical protein